MQLENIDRFRRIVSRILWILLALFCCRVLGQVLVEFFGVRFLPPSEEWFSGLIPYPRLLATQIAIILLFVKICSDLTTRQGWFHQPRNWFGKILLVFGSLYLLIMVVRYGVRMSLYPGERWTGGSIPIEQQILRNHFKAHVVSLQFGHKRLCIVAFPVRGRRHSF